MAVTITLKNYDIVKKSLDGVRADMPWVIQNSINNILKGAQQEQYATMRKNFTIRNEAFLKFSVRLQFATRQSGFGRIFIADLGGKKTSNIWNRFEGGAIKTPTKGKNIAIPSNNAWGNRNRPLLQRNRPRNLARSFVIKKGGNTFILARKGRKAKLDGSGNDANIKLMYTLKPNVRIPDKLHFYATLIPYVRNNYTQFVDDSLKFSLKSRGFLVSGI
jgi:hypothetical protein